MEQAPHLARPSAAIDLDSAGAALTAQDETGKKGRKEQDGREERGPSGQSGEEASKTKREGFLQNGHSGGAPAVTGGSRPG